jgi:hypothetical protein
MTYKLLIILFSVLLSSSCSGKHLDIHSVRITYAGIKLPLNKSVWLMQDDYNKKKVLEGKIIENSLYFQDYSPALSVSVINNNTGIDTRSRVVIPATDKDVEIRCDKNLVCSYFLGEIL